MVAIELEAELRQGARTDQVYVIGPEGFIASSKDQNFGTHFARDAAIQGKFALEVIRANPTSSENPQLLAAIKGSLRTMGKYQGTTVDPQRDEEPGKIAHEVRFDNFPRNQEWLFLLKRAGWAVDGEEGALSMRYYGSIDATPLFVELAIDHLEYTNDAQFAEEIDPHIRSALSWMENYGDKDGDSLLEFSAKNRLALLNQGWKDSGNSIEDKNGTRPKEPIALVEVQGYEYSAYLKSANYYRKQGDIDFAANLYKKAGILKDRFNAEFWMGDEGYFAYALDGEKKQIQEITSNVGHLLLSGIVEEEKLPRLVTRIMQPDMLTKSGIRTLSSKSPFFKPRDPEGYHNGSYWTFDNTLIYLGLVKNGFFKEAEFVRDANLYALGELIHKFGIAEPELYLSDKNDEPIPYPSAQKPQGWTIQAIRVMTETQPQLFAA